MRLTPVPLRFVCALLAAAPLIVTLGAGAAGRQAVAVRRAAGTAPVYGYKVVKTYPHDRGAFTQGLEYRGNLLYEGTGLYGRSSLRRVKLETGEVLQRTDLAPEYFGEGITVLKERVVQLTWKAERGFLYEQLTFKPIGDFQYPGEGWGLANDGTHIYMSDGSPEIRVWDPATLKEVRRFTVRDGDEEIADLNELEFIKGEIYANVWQTERIARISPKDGKVIAWIDLTGILPPDQRQGVDVMNGIAFDTAGDRTFVTGKLWPTLFQITLVPPQKR